MDESRSLADLGAALYGGEAPVAPAPGPIAEARTPEQIASAMHDKPEPLAEELPPEVKALRDADPARQVYDDRTAYKGAGIDKALAELGIEGQAADLAHREWAGVFADAGLDAQTASTLVEVAKASYSDETMQAWPEQAKASLREAFGEDDWQHALNDARLLVKRDPRVAKHLDETGLGNHPTVVRVIAQRARALIANGTLKRK